MMSPRTSVLRPFLATLTLLALALPVGAQEPEAPPADPPGVPLPVGGPLVPTGDTRVEPGVYLRPATEPEAPVILLEGLEGVLLDLGDVELRGASAEATPNSFAGYGVVLRDCVDVTVRGGVIGGYRVGLLAERCTGLVVEDVRVLGFRASRLLSTPSAEDAADRLDRDAGGDAWLAEYGAAFALVDCVGATVRGCRARGGQNGALLTRTRDSELYDNDFSFLSGWGVALHEATGNLLAHSRFDTCVRGYSHEVYSRDFGAAGVLMVGCADNRVVDCSIMRGSHGVELSGGTNNMVSRCNLSYAVIGALRAQGETGLRAFENVISGAHSSGFEVDDCEGVTLVGNSIDSVLGPAVHVVGGSEILLLRNVLASAEVGFELSGGASGPVREVWLEANSFTENDNDLLLSSVDGVTFSDNVFPTEMRELKGRDVTDESGRSLARDELRARLAGLGGWIPSGSLVDCVVRFAENLKPPKSRAAALAYEVEEVPGHLGPREAQGDGLASIVLDAWGPWDFASGAERPRSSAGGLLADVRWETSWFSWSEGPDPRGTEANLRAWRALAETPDHTAEVGVWSSPWGDDETRESVREAVGNDRFGLIGRTSIEIEAGRYRLSAVSDDGVRIRFDGAPILQNWSWHPATRNTIDLRLTGGRHDLIVEYFQIDGAAALSVDMVRLPDEGERTADSR